VKNAQKLLRKYKQGKSHLEKRVIASENWWKMRNWREIDPARQEEPVSAWRKRQTSGPMSIRPIGRRQ
ncbi:MAG: hypothetical protein IJF65_00745, partial [Clostridia bacterium]|nr:hypothetical protein [Clostridia bacterium]